MPRRRAGEHEGGSSRVVPHRGEGSLGSHVWLGPERAQGGSRGWGLRQFVSDQTYLEFFTSKPSLAERRSNRARRWILPLIYQAWEGPQSCQSPHFSWGLRRRLPPLREGVSPPPLFPWPLFVLLLFGINIERDLIPPKTGGLSSLQTPAINRAVWITVPS